MHDLVKTESQRGSGSLQVQYGAVVINATHGQRLLDAILDAGVDHRHVCGGLGFCTSCRVEVMSGAEGLSPVSALERERLGRDAGRLRLACQTTVHGDAGVQVPKPAPSRFSPDGD
jgi:2Fe-2S ferredoxin